jgi:transcriptional regulator with XRE-family HTH domain
MPPLPSDAAIGQALGKLREMAKLSQDQMARAMTGLGCPMTRVQVALIETGRRPLTYREQIAVIQILATGDASTPRDLHALLGTRPEPASSPLGASIQRWTKDYEHLWVTILGRGPVFPKQIGTDVAGDPIWSTPPDPTPAWLDVAALGDAENKAAVAERVPAEAVALGSWKLWGDSLTGERERRFMAHPGRTTGQTKDDRRRDQAIRGRVTRDLLGELRPLLAGLRRPRQRRRKR